MAIVNAVAVFLIDKPQIRLEFEAFYYFSVANVMVSPSVLAIIEP